MPKLNVDLTQSIKRLDIITRSMINSQIVGNYRSVFRGTGLEFNGYREYNPGDDSKLIDWKATVKSNKPLVKEFIEERNLNVFLMVDTSYSMFLGTTEKLKMEFCAEVSASLGYAVLQASDALGLIMFNENIIKSIPPSTGKRHFYKITKTLLDLDNYGGHYDIINVMKYSLGYIPRTSMVVILSDFIGLTGEWQKWLKVFALRYDTIGVMIRDPIDREMPDINVNIVLEDPSTGNQMAVNPHLIGQLYKQDNARQEAEIRRAFIDAGADFLALTTDKPFVKQIIDLFLRRAKRFI